MIFSPPIVENVTLSWIKSYAEKSNFENFRPHITVGFGKLNNVNVPIAFTAPVLALPSWKLLHLQKNFVFYTLKKVIQKETPHK